MKFSTFFFFLFFSSLLFAQAPFSGVNLPSFSNEERDKLSGLKDGFTIYNSSTKCINYYADGDWRALCGQCASLPPAPTILAITPFYNSVSIKLKRDKYKHKILQMPKFTMIQDTGFSSVILKNENTVLEGLTFININDCGSSEPYTIDNVGFDTKDPCGGATILTDSRNGKNYKIYAVGNQCWMSENLNFGQADKKEIFLNADNQQNFYAWNFGKVSKNPKTGQFESIPTTNKLCPAGWHIPTEKDANELVDFYHNYGSVELMRRSFQFDNNPQVYNPIDKVFEKQGDRLLIWTSTTAPNDDGRGAIFISEGDVLLQYIPKEAGLNLRCVKD